MLYNCEVGEGPRAPERCEPLGGTGVGPQDTVDGVSFVLPEPDCETLASGVGTSAVGCWMDFDTEALTPEELYLRREQLQLGNSFTMVGNLHNIVSAFTATPLPAETQADFTRVMCWNVGGGMGTLRSTEKLRFLTNTMLQQRVHLACITEGKVTLKELKRLLRQVNMHLHFRAFGKNGEVAWLVQTAVADKVVQTLDLQETRISGLVLAGECKQRTLVLGMYGFSGSTTDSRSARLQQELWEYITPLVMAAHRKGHHVCVLGDFNVVPTADLTSSERPLQTAIGHFCSWQQALQLDNALLTACPGASLAGGFSLAAVGRKRGHSLLCWTTSWPLGG